MYKMMDNILRIAQRGENYYLFNCNLYEEIMFNKDAMKIFKFMRGKNTFCMEVCLENFDIKAEQLNEFVDFLLNLNLIQKVES